MEKFIKAFFYFVFSIIGLFAGIYLHKYTLPLFQSLSQDLISINMLMFIALGVIAGLAVAPLTSNAIITSIEHTIKRLLAAPLKQIIGGVAGLIIGLIISSLTMLIVSTIPFSEIKVGKYIFCIIVITLSIFISYICVFFGAKIIGNVPISKQSLGSRHGLDFLWGTKYKILDTSAIIDGRIYDVTKSGFIEGTIAIPRFVLNELQAVADSADDLKRSKGRRGLDMLDMLRKDFSIQIIEQDYPAEGVDNKLILLALEIKAVLITTDYNLNKLASLQGIEVLNINDLTNAVKSQILPGEIFKIRVIKEGKEHNQGVGYLDSGTMVVIENGKKYIGEEITVEATSSLQTSAGRMIFVKVMP